MKVEIENLNGHYKKLNIEIPAEIVSQRVDSHFKELQREVALKGFRKGKVPMDMVRSLYTESETPRITRQIVEEYLQRALDEHSLQPVARPQVDGGLIQPNNQFKFTATFENMPAIELKDYSGLKLPKTELKASEQDIEVALKNIQQQLTQLMPLAETDTLTEGLVAQLDYDATEAGKAIPEASAKDAWIEPGQSAFMEPFESKLLGARKGDKREFDVKFPKEFKATDGKNTPHPFAERTFHFTTDIKALFKKDAPEINDEFATKAGPFKDLSELRARISTEVLKQKEETDRKERQEKAIEWLLERNPVDAPETMITQQIQNLAIEAGMQLQQMGLAQDAIETRLKEWGEEMTQRAGTQVKASLLLGAVARKEKIQASEEDIRNEISRMALQSGRNPQEIVKDMQDKGLIPGFLRQLTELKALDWILEKAV